MYEYFVESFMLSISTRGCVYLTINVYLHEFYFLREMKIKWFYFAVLISLVGIEGNVY